MKFVIQTNIFAEESFEHLLTAVERLGQPRCLVKCIPFGGGLEVVEGGLPSDGERAIVLGSYTMCRVARERGWTPGAFLENLDFRIQNRAWPSLLLNHDAEIFEFGKVPFQERPFFIRPVHDTKSFTGFVCDWTEYRKWHDGIVRMGPEPDFGLDTLVMICREKEIYSETRTWVIDGRVVTSSGYKVGRVKRYTTPEQVEPRVIAYAEDCIGVWQPNRAFVLDVADTPEGLFLVEVNCLNSAGWYRCDMNKLVQALSDL